MIVGTRWDGLSISITAKSLQFGVKTKNQVIDSFANKNTLFPPINFNLSSQMCSHLSLIRLKVSFSYYLSEIWNATIVAHCGSLHIGN